MKTALLACIFVLFCIVAHGQDLQQQCGNHPDLFRDGSGQPKWFSSPEVEKMATRTTTPEAVALPNGLPYSGFVSVRLMVNTAGDVVCLWDASGHPLMIASAIRAIHQWKFKPMTAGGRKVEFVGLLKVPVRSTGQ